MLHQVRIKNPGQGSDWTVDNVWTHIQTIRRVFRERGKLDPIIHLHNHDFNGLGAHIAKELYLRAQANNYSLLVIDGAYRKSHTHNDNTVMLSGLRLNAEQKEALVEYNHVQQQIEAVLRRFNGRNSQMTPWDSDWAGGTEGSDLRIAKEYGLNPRQINHAKEVASEVFPLERAVTPFSEYKLRLGIAIMIETAIEPKTPDAVRAFISEGGKLKVGGEVLVGLERWQTLVDRPLIVNKLLDNMRDELETALTMTSSTIDPSDLPQHFTPRDKFTALGFQQKGLDFLKLKGQGKDLTPLILAPHVLHRQPRTLNSGTRFMLFTPRGERQQVEFLAFGTNPKGDVTCEYLHAGKKIMVALPDPDAKKFVTTESGPRKADESNANHLGTVVPGEVLEYFVKEGEILKEGQAMCVLESMKMEMKLPVPDHLVGKKVKLLPCTGRTKEKQGTLLKPGDLLIEVEDA